MLRTTTNVAARRATGTPVALGRVPARGMASEQQLKLRIATVTNVKKITSTMKMVAAAKLRGAQRVLEVARVFGTVTDAWPAHDATPTSDGKHLILGICSDKGLCGGINSGIVRAIRDSMKAHKPTGVAANTDIVLFGQKGVQGLERLHGEEFTTSVTDMGKTNFTQVCEQAEVLTSMEYATGEAWYQYFRSMMAYDTVKVPFDSYEAAINIDGKEVLGGYQRWGGVDILRNFHEFRTAVHLFGFLCETETATLSSRMAAMEGSSKNAGEMLDSLTLILNRSRQSRITTELIEIISGASAAEDMQKS